MCHRDHLHPLVRTLHDHLQECLATFGAAPDPGCCSAEVARVAKVDVELLTSAGSMGGQHSAVAVMCTVAIVRCPSHRMGRTTLDR